MGSVTRAAAVVALLLICSVANAASLTLCFARITNNSGDAAAVDQLATQLEVDVFDAGGGWIGFTAINNNVAGAIGSFIADMYWDDDAGVLDFISPILAAGWDTPASPSNLSGGGAASPAFNADFSVDADPPPSTNGFSPGESGTFKISLVATKTYADVVAALTAGELRLGMHVQGVDIGSEPDGQSESFVSFTKGGGVIPEPGSMALLGLGLLGLGTVARRRGKRA